MIGKTPTYEEILQRCLDRVPNTLDKRQGSIIYDALAPACLEMAQMYIEGKSMLDLVFIDTTSEVFLDRKAKELGLTRKNATYSVRKGTFNIAVDIGARFSIKNIVYRVESQIGNYIYRLVCETAGSIGNEYFGDLTPVSYISGLNSAVLSDIIISAEDKETDEELRQRYIEYVSQPAFGGNISDYKNKTKEISGVGGVKVFPVWNGGGTVKLVITNNDNDVPTAELVTNVQNIIDPAPGQEGKGVAPIGHKVTVEGATQTVINITTTITIKSGYSQDDIKPIINTLLAEYFSILRKEWELTDSTVIRTSQIDTRVLSVDGVEDVNGTLINGVNANKALISAQIPKLGTVVINVNS